MDSQKPEESERAWASEDETLKEGKWYIRNPWDLTIRIECNSLEEAMDWYKGFNVPYIKGDTFVSSVKRVFKYHHDIHEQINYDQAYTILKDTGKEKGLRRFTEVSKG